MLLKPSFHHSTLLKVVHLKTVGKGSFVFVYIFTGRLVVFKKFSPMIIGPSNFPLDRAWYNGLQIHTRVVNTLRWMRLLGAWVKCFITSNLLWVACNRFQSGKMTFHTYTKCIDALTDKRRVSNHTSGGFLPSLPERTLLSSSTCH